MSTAQRKRKRPPSIIEVEVDSLTVNEANPRSIEPDRLEDLMASLKSDPAMLWARPVVALKDGKVIAGNMRLIAARELGWAKIPTIRVDIDDKQARMWMLRDNQQYGEWVDHEVGALLQELSDVGADLLLTGFAGHEVDALLTAAFPQEDEVDPDELPDPPDAVTKPGDMWELGRHRIMCGDASDEGVMKKLAGTDPVAIVFTDPPYGVDYEGRTKDSLKLRNDSLSQDAHKDLLYKVFSSVLERRRPGATWYVCAPSMPPYVLSFLDPLERLGIWQHTLVWVKDSFVLGRSDFHYRHELVLYGWAAGEHQSPPDRRQDTVWEIPRPTANKQHPTMKPVALVERALKLSSKPGDIVLDPFAGSGTTIVAAERTSRTCRAIEIEPRYVDVAVARFESVTGTKAKLHRRGRRKRSESLGEEV